VRQFDRSFLEPVLTPVLTVSEARAQEEAFWAQQKVYADILGYPVHIDPTIGDGPDVYPCPSPRPAGAPAANDSTQGSAHRSHDGLT
jgi:hypothetical protein